MNHLETFWIGQSNGIDGHIEKFEKLKSVLPEEEKGFKAKIDAGIKALEKMKKGDDSGLTDFSALGVVFADYFLANEKELDKNPDSDLRKAFYDFLGEEQGVHGGGPPQRFFQYFTGQLFVSYIQYYPLEEFNTEVPEYAKVAMVDSLSWVTPSGDDTGEGHFNVTLVYYFAEYWNLISPRLDQLSEKQRELVLTQLEDALLENDFYLEATVNKAKESLAKARVRFPKK